MRDEYLQFERCLDRLKHSFLRVSQWYQSSYIDFQHPSLRDMLLSFLQTEPIARRQYISLASPEGLSEIIQGISYFGSPPTDEIHRLVIQDETELDLLCERIRNIVTHSILAYDQIKLLRSTKIILPHRKKKRVSPAEVDLERFQNTPRGKVVGTLVRAIANENIYKNNLTYKLSSWTDILKEFYDLASYIVPVPRPAYLHNLTSPIKEVSISTKVILSHLPFIHLFSVNEPIIFRQIFSQSLVQKLDKSFISESQKCYDELYSLDGATTSDKEEYEQMDYYYEDLKNRANDLLEEGEILYHLSRTKEPEVFSNLEDLVDNMTPPILGMEDEEQEEEEEEYRISKSDEEYWTIERLFEDL